MNESKLIGEIYGVLLTLKEKFDNDKHEIDFYTYSQKEIEKLRLKALEWMADDEREGLDDED